jgi:hypothetical protein
VPLASEWQQLGASIGSPAPWSGLPHLMGFTEGSDSWTTSTRPLRNTDDRYGFRWLADIFIPNISKGSYGVGGKNNITYGAFWSAGLGSNEDMFTEAIKRVAAAVDNGWASDPLAVDTVNGGPAGSKGRDFLPVRCVLGQGPMTAWIYDSDRYDDGYEAPEENPCTIGGCSCGIDAGTIFGGHNNCPAIEPGVIGVAEATVEVCKNIKHPGAIGCFPEE